MYKAEPRLAELALSELFRIWNRYVWSQFSPSYILTKMNNLAEFKHICYL